jgi:hypothetical protein
VHTLEIDAAVAATKSRCGIARKRAATGPRPWDESPQH